MAAEKILGREQLKERVNGWRKAGDSITLANGCFDLLHVGHIRYLHAAKQPGGRLIVAINSDDSVRALKGEGRVGDLGLEPSIFDRRYHAVQQRAVSGLFEWTLSSFFLSETCGH